MEIILGLISMGVSLIIPIFIVYSIFSLFKSVLNTQIGGMDVKGGSPSSASDIDGLLREAVGNLKKRNSEATIPNLAADFGNARNSSKPKKQKKNPKTPRSSLAEPTSHNEHDCDGVNYDEMGALTGGSGGFNLGETSWESSCSAKQGLTIDHNDLLKSFVMSEVLQRYDINRIYSRIPSVGSDD